MKSITPDLTKLIFDDLPKPLHDWWQPASDTDEETQLRLHHARIAFTRAVMRLHNKPCYELYSGGRSVVSISTQFHLMREQVAQARLREVEDLKIDLPEDPVAVPAVRQKIFPHLPSDLSRYMYLTLLRDVDRCRFNYPGLRQHFSLAKLHVAIVSLASRLAWKLCLIDESGLHLRIRGCVHEMSGGSVEDFMQWCGDSVAADLPFFGIDHILRRCLIPITHGIDFHSFK